MKARIRQIVRAATNDPFEQLDSYKKEMIDFACSGLGMQTFADLGGVWRVEGGYTFYAADRNPIKSGAIVDTHFTDVVLNKLKRYPKLKAIVGNFGTREIHYKVGKVDGLFFFDTLLHQVRPDWNEVLKMYSDNARIFLILNQQYTNFSKTTRLLDLGTDEYFRITPHLQSEEPLKSYFKDLDAIHPEHKRPFRDVHSIWQWGITDSDLVGCMNDLGFKMQFYKNCGQFGDLQSVENHAFVFKKVTA